MESRQSGRRAARQILTALLATIPTFTYGIQIGWPSPTGPLLQSPQSPSQEPISDATRSWLAGAFPLAAILGVPFFSYSSDKYGRKICIIAMSVLDAISWTVKLTIVTSASLIIARIIAGLAAGGCFVVIPAYIKEISEDSWRGTLASLTMTVSKLGVIFVYAMALFINYHGNQGVFLGVAVAHAIAFTFMPESPNYLLKIGKEKQAIKTLSWLRSVPRSDEVVTTEISRLKDEHHKYDAIPKISLLSVVKDRATFAAVRMTLTLMAMQTLCGSFALMTFAADVFKKAGSEWSPNTLALFMGSLQLGGSFFTTITIEKFGRKLPLLVSSLTVSMCMTTLATCFYMNTAASWPRVAAVCLAVLAYGIGLAPVPMVILAEVFAYQFRAKMAGVSMAFSFFCSAMSVLFYTPVANQFGIHVVFYTFGAISFYGAVYTLFFVPETKGKSLQQIQKFWRKSEPVYV